MRSIAGSCGGDSSDDSEKNNRVTLLNSTLNNNSPSLNDSKSSTGEAQIENIEVSGHETVCEVQHDNEKIAAVELLQLDELVKNVITECLKASSLAITQINSHFKSSFELKKLPAQANFPLLSNSEKHSMRRLSMLVTTLAVVDLDIIICRISTMALYGNIFFTLLCNGVTLQRKRNLQFCNKSSQQNTILIIHRLYFSLITNVSHFIFDQIVPTTWFLTACLFRKSKTQCLLFRICMTFHSRFKLQIGLLNYLIL